MFVLQERKYHGRQITLSRKVFRYLFYRKANIRVDVTEDVLAFGIVLHKFFTEEETAPTCFIIRSFLISVNMEFTA